MCVTKLDVVLPLADIVIGKYFHFALLMPSFLPPGIPKYSHILDLASVLNKASKIQNLFV